MKLGNESKQAIEALALEIVINDNVSMWINMILIFLINTIYCFFPNGTMNT